MSSAPGRPVRVPSDRLQGFAPRPRFAVAGVQEADGMRTEQAAGLSCAACGRGFLLGDVVIVIRDVPPSWASAIGEAMTIVHVACERAGGPADYNWTSEPPQTLAHVLVRMADDHGRRRARGPWSVPTSVEAV